MDNKSLTANESGLDNSNTVQVMQTTPWGQQPNSFGIQGNDSGVVAPFSRFWTKFLFPGATFTAFIRSCLGLFASGTIIGVLGRTLYFYLNITLSSWVCFGIAFLIFLALIAMEHLIKVVVLHVGIEPHIAISMILLKSFLVLGGVIVGVL